MILTYFTVSMRHKCMPLCERERAWMDGGRFLGKVGGGGGAEKGREGTWSAPPVVVALLPLNWQVYTARFSAPLTEETPPPTVPATLASNRVAFSSVLATVSNDAPPPAAAGTAIVIEH